MITRDRMDTITSLAQEFLSLPSIAIVGISSSKQNVANTVFRKLRAGRAVIYPVGRNTPVFEDGPCYPDLASLPTTVRGVFIAVRPENIPSVIDQCIALKVTHVWLHNSGGTSLPAAMNETRRAVERCRANHITVIPGACPMMFVKDADLGHRCMKWFLSVTGNLK